MTFDPSAFENSEFVDPSMVRPSPPQHVTGIRSEVTLRSTCGDRHWWWPAPQEGDRCLCGEQAWSQTPPMVNAPTLSEEGGECPYVNAICSDHPDETEYGDSGCAKCRAESA